MKVNSCKTLKRENIIVVIRKLRKVKMNIEFKFHILKF